jgi:SAM-dependent methyltransferase
MHASVTTFQCIQCLTPFNNSRIGTYCCPKCGESYEIAAGYIKTYFDKALFNAYRKDYLINKVLNNNGFISYQHLPDASVSLPNRRDVIRFRKFIEQNQHGRNILDIGCGPMELPGYLRLKNLDTLKIIGLDPCDSQIFHGLRIVGCSEFVPLPDASIDTIIFATSMDHVCNLDKTITEARRLLSSSGRVLVWMSDRSSSFKNRLKNWLKQRYQSWRRGYPVDKYYLYDNWTVLGVPRGGVDPFHSYHESPKKIAKFFAKKNLILYAEQTYSPDEVFLCFQKIV